MPYIADDLRIDLNGAIDELSARIESQRENDIDGCVNYSICKILKAIYPDREMKYRVLNRMMGVLSCITQEVYRRVVAEHEDNAIEKNGDIF